MLSASCSEMLRSVRTCDPALRGAINTTAAIPSVALTCTNRLLCEIEGPTFTSAPARDCSCLVGRRSRRRLFEFGDRRRPIAMERRDGLDVELQPLDVVVERLGARHRRWNERRA